MIAIRKIWYEKSIGVSTFNPEYYEIVLLLNPKMDKNVKNYEWPIIKYISVKP
jgi:hypothetical protein